MRDKEIAKIDINAFMRSRSIESNADTSHFIAQMKVSDDFNMFILNPASKFIEKLLEKKYLDVSLETLRGKKSELVFLINLLNALFLF